MTRLATEIIKASVDIFALRRAFPQNGGSIALPKLGTGCVDPNPPDIQIDPGAICESQLRCARAVFRKPQLTQARVERRLGAVLVEMREAAFARRLR
jgi:hypothetical protein